MSSDDAKQATAAADSNNTNDNNNSENNNNNTAPAEAAAAAPAELHKLFSAWSLWYMPETGRAGPGSPATAADMTSILRKADSFQSVEEFWSVYNALPSCDKLNVGEQFMFFRDPIRPVWEDPALAHGESLTVSTDNVDGADTFIQRFLMAALGESMTQGQFRGKQNIIAGLRYQARKKAASRFFKLDVWTTTSEELHAEVEGAVKAIAESSGIRNPTIYTQEFAKKT